MSHSDLRQLLLKEKPADVPLSITELSFFFYRRWFLKICFPKVRNLVSLPLEGKGDRLRWMRCRMRSIRVGRRTPSRMAPPHPARFSRHLPPKGKATDAVFSIIELSFFFCRRKNFKICFPKVRNLASLPLEGKGDRLRWMRCRMRSFRVGRRTPSRTAPPHPARFSRHLPPKGKATKLPTSHKTTL